jgi:hypothetical protein
MLGRLRDWARKLKRDVGALWLAARDKRTPKRAKFVALGDGGLCVEPHRPHPRFRAGARAARRSDLGAHRGCGLRVALDPARV